MKEIRLTKGQMALVDDSDYEYLNQFTWQAVDNHGSDYARTTICHNGRKHPILMHRLLIGCPAGLEIDHIDRNPLNNQRNNLRMVTHWENLQNRKRTRNPICSRCNENPKYKQYAYCLPCFRDYQREYRLLNIERIRERDKLYKRKQRL